MIFRSLLAGVMAAGFAAAGEASAQVLLCPEPPSVGAEDIDLQTEAGKLLKRLSVALDLYGHEAVSQEAILAAHAETPAVLLAKLSNVANRCSFAVSDDLREFRERLPELRQLFLEAVGIVESPEQAMATEGAGDAAQGDVKAAADDEAEALEEEIKLSSRELWQKLWFRFPSDGEAAEHRWAVIVSSPTSADEGWDQLAEHQEHWKDVYFQLHQPHYSDNQHHAIVVGRRLREREAERLLGYVKDLGMAEDAFKWPVPVETLERTDAIAKGPAERPAPLETVAVEPEVEDLEVEAVDAKTPDNSEAEVEAAAVDDADEPKPVASRPSLPPKPVLPPKSELISEDPVGKGVIDGVAEEAAVDASDDEMPPEEPITTAIEEEPLGTMISQETSDETAVKGGREKLNIGVVKD